MSKEAFFKRNHGSVILTAFFMLCLMPIDLHLNAEAINFSLSNRGFRIGGGGSGFSFGFGSGGGGGGIADALCTVVYWFTEEGIGQAIASLAVIFLGIQAFFGKVQWGTALMFVAGIFAIFGSADIVDAITGGLSSGGC